ncbi:MAG: hypothetical protein ACLGI7_07340 [Gammaproteobacteria bacterium]
MHKIFLLTAVIGLTFAPALRADVLRMPEPDTAATIEKPERGMSQAAVRSRFGEPLKRHAPVGGGSPERPPITRWDYSGYSVFFENSTVIDVVIPGQPAPVHHVDELQGG